MRKPLPILLALALITISTSQVIAADQDDLDVCISHWTKGPFKKGTPADKVITTNVKVFGLGGTSGDTEKTEEPKLILMKPAVNVLGKSTIRLENPNGWYCFGANVSVLGKINIEAACKAEIANSREGATVLGADDSHKGVAILGSLRIKRFGCENTTN